MSTHTPPSSPNDEVSGYVYFARLCSKIRLHQSGELDPEFHPNMGKTDQEALEWCWQNGSKPKEYELDWWNSYMRNRCYRDDLSDLLARRKQESGWQDRADIQTMFDYLDADDGRL
jgi:gluconokinase